MEIIFSKILDIFLSVFWRATLFFFKNLSPLKIAPKKVVCCDSEGFLPIISLKIRNRDSRSLYNVRIAGVSKEKFEVKIINHDLENKKTVEKMNINTNLMVSFVKDKISNNYGWVLVIHEILGGSNVNLRIKIDSNKDVYFKVMDYNYKEEVIAERKDGVVKIPFADKSLPKI